MDKNYTSEFIGGIEVRTDTRISCNLKLKQIKVLTEIPLSELVEIVSKSIDKDISKVIVVSNLSERILD